MGGKAPSAKPALELDALVGTRPRQVRDWCEEQMLAAGIDSFIAYRLALIGVDYRAAVHMKELGMSDDGILDQFLDY